MSDPLTPDERAAIDAHLCEHGVDRVPRGETREGVIWDPDREKLVPRDGQSRSWYDVNRRRATARQEKEEAKARAEANRQQREWRRVQVVELRGQGLSFRAIGDRLNISPKLACMDMRRVGTE